MLSKLSLAIAIVTAPLLGCGSESPTAIEASEGAKRSESLTPLDVVNERMAAYNNHDLTAFMATYANDVEVFTYPDNSLGKGKKHLQSIFEPMFVAGSVEVEIHHQIAKDSYVVNHETVTDGADQTEYVSIYEVAKGQIQSVRFVRD